MLLGLKHPTATSIRLTAAQHAAGLAVWSGLRTFKPYNYQPCIKCIPQDPRTSAAELRRLLIEHGDCLGEYITASGEQESGLIAEAIAQLSNMPFIPGHSVFALLSVAFDCRPSRGRLAAIAYMIHSGRIDEAERQLVADLDTELAPMLRSRYLANLATVQELNGEGRHARRLAAEAMQCGAVSPLAVTNYTIYCITRAAG